MFILSGLSAPIVKILVKTFAAGLAAGKKDHESDSDEDDPKIYMLTSPTHYSKKNRVSALTQRFIRRSPTVDRIEELDDDGSVTVAVC